VSRDDSSLRPSICRLLQVCGQAQYTDDVPLPSDTLHAVFVTSTKPHAKLVKVDPSAALAMEGVEGYFDHRYGEGRLAECGGSESNSKHA
jgi:CO/xanthine dehydrogenase Mo-binding subunit